MRKYTLSALCILFISTSYADVSGDLGNFFSSLGYEGNITSAKAYQSQAAGYYSAGNAYLRNQVRTIQIVHIDTPGYRSGCGGIDLFAGGFSFINSDELIKFAKNIMTNSAGYAFNLALETEVPEIKYVLGEMQDMANKVNNANMSSCEMAEDMVGGLWPKTRASQQQVCQDVGSQNNMFSDWAAARQGCGTGSEFNQAMDDASKDARYKDRVIVNKNLVWAAIQANGFLAEDTQLAELFMSLSGTIVYDASGNASVYYPLSSSRNLIKAMLEGGTAQIYVCDEPKSCLKPTLGNLTINKEDALNQKVISILNSIMTEVQNDSPITDAQKGFLNTVSIPVLKFITVSLSLKMGAQALDLTEYSSLIAKDLLKQYMLESIQIVQQSLTRGSYTPEIQQKLERQVETALQAVEGIKTNTHQDLQDEMMLIQNMRQLESQSTANMSSSLKDSLSFNEVQA